MHSISTYVREQVERDVLRARERARIPQAVIPSFRVAAHGEPDASILEQLPDEPSIMFAGALRRVKGVETLLTAYRLLVSPPPLVLLGTFESDTPAEFPAGVITPGGGSYATVLAAWDRSLFGVMPSLWPEPFGSVVHEAMSRGTAVIGTTPGGHTDMIEHEQTGLLVALGDVPALRAAMQRLIDDRGCARTSERTPCGARPISPLRTYCPNSRLSMRRLTRRQTASVRSPPEDIPDEAGLVAGAPRRCRSVLTHEG